MASNPHRLQPLIDNPPQMSAAKKGSLAAVVGAAAAAALLTLVPEEESGRKVRAEVGQDGTAKVTHLAGRQYLRAYLDIAGVATACDGITRGVRMGQTYSEAQCTSLLERELVIHAQGVMRCTPALADRGRDWQRVAAVSLAYNIGVAGWCGSTAARRFNARDWRAGCDAFLRWDKARVNGSMRPVLGLVRRRERERALCLKGLA